MRPAPQHRALLDRLAAEYVLGTLRGGARRRYARWRAESALVDGLCQRWEERLAGLASQLRPLAPPAAAWAGVRRRLRLEPPAVLRWAAMLALVALLGALLYPGFGGRVAAPDQIALISTPAGALQWRVEVYTQRGRLVMVSPGLAAKPANRDYELWALPGGDAPAVSLGVMPARGEQALKLSAAQRAALAHARQVAVSVEPIGGSPTGHATGPVVFVAPLRGVG